MKHVWKVMGRVLASAVVLFAAVVVLNSCSGSDNSPEGIVNSALTKLQEKDYAGYVDLIRFSEPDAGKLEQKKTALLELVQKKFDKSMEQKQGLRSWEILSTEISESGDAAVVKVKLVYGDGSEDNQDIKVAKTEDGKWMVDAGK
ncbi:MAG: DUF4878 domain-containing protein [Prevotella sp.]